MSLRLPQPLTADPAEAPALRWGVLAPGGIARTFATSLRGTRQRIVAAGSRSLARAEAFTAEFGGRPHGSYESLVADPDVDVVYVASPHSEHRDHALLAIEAGKHVLVEKAFTRNAAEARDVITAASTAGVFCMEAMWSRFLPHYDVVRQAVAGGLIGDVRWVGADHGQALHPNGPQRLEDPALAGGALLDLGIYPVSFAHMLLPEARLEAASGVLTERGVDESLVLALRDGEAMASLGTTMATQTPNTAVVAGTRGRIELDGWFYFPTTVTLKDTDGQTLDTYVSGIGDHALRYEAAEVARCIGEERTESPRMPLAETARIMDLLDDVRAAVGVRFPGE